MNKIFDRETNWISPIDTAMEYYAAVTGNSKWKRRTMALCTRLEIAPGGGRSGKNNLLDIYFIFLP